MESGRDHSENWNRNPTTVFPSMSEIASLRLPPDRKKDPAYLERAETYAKRALSHFNSVEGTEFEFKSLMSFYMLGRDTMTISFYVNRPNEGDIAARFSARVVQGEVCGCAVRAPDELLAEFELKHAINKYNKEEGADYAVVEILGIHRNIICGYTRSGYWTHYNFTAVSRRSNESPVLFFAEGIQEYGFESPKFSCRIVDPRNSDATYECEMCPCDKRIWHPSYSPVGSLVRGPAFAARHHDSSDIFHGKGFFG